MYGRPIMLTDGQTITGIFYWRDQAGKLNKIQLHYATPELHVSVNELSTLEQHEYVVIDEQKFQLNWPPLKKDTGIAIIKLSPYEAPKEGSRWR
ncbi:hypothetical protein KCM76_25670 [Zooshikella marina]|uniref:head-tail joining protein n=1 Tax=Zooshikella ganghwensis TaxID=202772 RepID=UPI001BAEBB35|nr:hypothetical protein [Zooshikella ganghwensis]MBU2709406.1 hypothetical protein [Zooshikella ganghwensis]